MLGGGGHKAEGCTGAGQEVHRDGTGGVGTDATYRTIMQSALLLMILLDMVSSLKASTVMVGQPAGRGGLPPPSAQARSRAASSGHRHFCIFLASTSLTKPPLARRPIVRTFLGPITPTTTLSPPPFTSFPPRPVPLTGQESRCTQCTSSLLKALLFLQLQQSAFFPFSTPLTPPSIQLSPHSPGVVPHPLCVFTPVMLAPCPSPPVPSPAPRPDPHNSAPPPISPSQARSRASLSVLHPVLELPDFPAPSMPAPLPSTPPFTSPLLPLSSPHRPEVAPHPVRVVLPNRL